MSLNAPRAGLRFPRISLLSTMAIASVLLSSCHDSSSGGGTSNAAQRLQEIEFLSRQEIAVGAAGLRAFVAADFSGNGALDLVTTSLLDRRVVFQAASAPGTFAPQQTAVFDLGSIPTVIVAGDFDGDADLDFACAYPERGAIEVWRNNGTGGFTLDTSPLQGGSSLGDLVAGDFDGDGKTDLVAGRGSELALRWFRGGATGFELPVDFTVPGPGFVTGLSQGDLDADGDADLVVCNGQENRAHVFLGAPTGLTTTPASTVQLGGSGVLSSALGDFDRDGKLDFVAACYGCGSVLFRPGDGAGNFGAERKTPGDGQPIHVSRGDIDADGNLDAVVSYIDRASIGFLKGDGQGGFAAERQFGTTGLPTMTQIVDLDGDGNQDVISSGLDSMHLSWIRSIGAGGLVGAEHFSTGHSSPNFTIAADFDADGYADTMVSDRQSGLVNVLPGGANGRFGASVYETPVGNLPAHISKGDFDRDGRIDGVIALSNGLRILLNRSTPGTIAFEPWPAITQPPFAVGVGPFEVASVDANRDGALDLLVADFGGNRVLVLRGQTQGFGFDPQPFALPVGGGPLSLVTGDFDRDGITDAAVSRYFDGFVTVLRGDGAGEFRIAADLPAGVSPNYLRKADFDGNGTEDLVVSNLGGSELTLFLSQAIDAWTGRALRVGDGPTALLARDLDNDGKSDLLVANADSADFYVLLGDGTGGFPISKRFPGTWGALSADLGDVDGDGRPDFVIASLFANRIGLYLNRSR